MSKFSQVHGLVYRVFNSKESDRILSLINSKGSKKTVLVKGARKSNSKKGSLIDIGNVLKIKIVESYSIPIASEIQLIQDFSEWKKNYKQLIFMQLLFEIIDKFTYEENDHPEMYKLLLNILDQDTFERPVYLLSVFIAKLLEYNGILEYDYELNPTDNEVQENMSKFLAKEDIRIRKTQKYIEQNNVLEALKIRLTPTEEVKMLKLHVQMIETIIEQELKSKKILYSLIK